MKTFTGIPTIPFTGPFQSFAVAPCPLPNAQYRDVVVPINWDAIPGTTNNFWGQTLNLQTSSSSSNSPPLDRVVSVYIDNLDVSVTVYVFFPSSQQTVECPPHQTVWSPVLTNDLNVNVYAASINNSPNSSSKLGTTAVHFLNCLSNPFTTLQRPNDQMGILNTFSVSNISANTTQNYTNPTTFLNKPAPLYLEKLIYHTLFLQSNGSGGFRLTFNLQLVSGFTIVLFTYRNGANAISLSVQEFTPVVVPLNIYVDSTWTLQASWTFDFPGDVSSCYSDCTVYGVPINSP